MKNWREKLESWIARLSRPATNAVLIATGIVILFGMSSIQSWLQNGSDSLQSSLSQLLGSRGRLADTGSEYRSLTELRTHDVSQLKQGILKLTKSRKAVFEAGVGIQEEKRILEKQWEIISTYLALDETAKKIHVMRGEQALESYPVANAPPGAVDGEAKVPPVVVQITSKERFAHTERGNYQEINGQLVWNPPQVGTSARANALGEYVAFTNSSLILHGPPASQKEHDAFPHYCLGLSLATAQKLYKNTFIGTKIVLRGK